MAEYIEREALYKRIDELADEAKYKALRLPDSDTEKIRYVGIWGGLCDALYVVRSSMTADVAPVVHGRWVYDGGSEYVDHYHCEECGTEIDLCDEICTEPKPSYCKNCGSRMDKEADDAQ